MKKTTALAALAALLGQNPVLLSAAQNATVQSVRVSADSVYIATDRPVQYKVFTMDDPPKLVVELLDAKMKTLQEIPVNGPALLKVRTGQFKTSPVSVSRVVMDLPRKTAYEITRKGTELIIMLGARRAPALKDTPAEPSGAKLIPPAGAAASSGKPVELTLEPDPVKPADPARENAPVITPTKSVRRQGSRNIMDNLPRDPVTFDYNGADVREVVDMMAAKANINIIYGDDVTGTVTISLSKVPFDEAFNTLLNVKGLAAQQTGANILRIASPATLIAEQKKAMLQTRVFYLGYSKASDVKGQIDSAVAAEGRTGHSIADDINNALVITDTPQGLDSTARLIQNLDRAPKQVMIEVKLVEVDLDHSFDLGVDWNFANNANAVSGKVSFAGPIPGAGVNAASFSFGKLVGNTQFNALIAAAVHDKKAKVLSDPKVATLNNKEASINITDQTPYDQQTITVVNGVTSTAHAYSNVTTGITLKVTPTINYDGRITMHLIPSVIQLSGIPTGIAPPPTATRNTDTNVVVKDGETIVIGGLIQDTQSDDVYKVPVLGDIPLLGALFRKKSVSRSRKELLIFVTPKLIED